MDRHIISQHSSNSSLEEFNSTFTSAYSQQPYSTLSWLLQALYFLSPLFGGFIVGLIVREKGLLYGVILGILFIPTLIVINFLSVSFGPIPTEVKQSWIQEFIIGQLLHSPITIALTAAGGYLGEFFHKRNLKKKKTSNRISIGGKQFNSVKKNQLP